MQQDTLYMQEHQQEGLCERGQQSEGGGSLELRYVLEGPRASVELHTTGMLLNRTTGHRTAPAVRSTPKRPAHWRLQS